MDNRIREILSEMTVRQKASLLYGRDFWFIRGSEANQSLPDIMMTDGPHGLRKQCGESDMIGMNESVPATAFPSGATTACSWDPDLLQKIGEALGEECVKENVAVLLGPAVNHKRDPLCGRNFEYFSEDPLLTGKLGAAMVRGIQSRGVGACVKHFACNSQENSRMYEDSIVDERALREIYLKQFEIIVKESDPWTMMTAYNKVDGKHCSENSRLMTEIARKEWGYQGLFMTDWSAMRDQIAAYRAGLDLEMPGTVQSDIDIENAVNCGALPEAVLDARAGKVIELLLKNKERKPKIPAGMIERHLTLAREAAEQSAVLLKNEGVLPFPINEPLAVIGSFAKEPRYQGGGSSKINPIVLDCTFDCLKSAGVLVEYAAGYGRNDTVSNAELIAEAVSLAKRHKNVALFVGLPEACESEGYDRDTMELPPAHIALIQAVLNANPQTAVILSCGAPITMPWKENAAAILLMYLAGCQGGAVCANLLLGKSNPCGKLAETFPLCYQDTPTHLYYNKHEDYAEYRESIFTGYRWYDATEKEVLFPFGHGLSYTHFGYYGLSCDKRAMGSDETVTITFHVKNEGKFAGKEIVQVYVSHENPTLFKAKKELKAFTKISLVPGESKTVRFTLGHSAFEFYNTKKGKWQVESGSYRIFIGASLRDLRLSADLSVTGESSENIPDYREMSPVYYDIAKQKGDIPEEQFLALAGHAKPKERDRSIITKYSPIKDLEYSQNGKAIFDSIVKRASSNPDPELAQVNLMVALEMPVMNMFMGNSPRGEVQKMIDLANGIEKK